MVSRYYKLFNDDGPQPQWITSPEIITRDVIADAIVRCDGNDEEIRHMLDEKVRTSCPTVASFDSCHNSIGIYKLS